MTRRAWLHTVGARLAGASLLALCATGVFVAANIAALDSVAAQEEWARAAAQVGVSDVTEYFRLALAAGPKTRAAAVGRLHDEIDRVDREVADLEDGNAERGVPRPSDDRLLDGVRDLQRDIAKKRVLQEAALETTSPAEAGRLAADVERATLHVADQFRALGARASRQAKQRMDAFRVQQYVFAAVLLVVFGLVFWTAKHVSGRVRALAKSAEEVSGGDLATTIDVGGQDEIGGLGRSLSAMTRSLAKQIETEAEGRRRLEELVLAVRETVGRLASVAPELVSATTEQAASAQQQLASVTETMSTIEEMTAVTQQSAERARGVAASTQRTDELGRAGQQAVADTIEEMQRVKEQAEAIAQRSVDLAEQTQAVGEIVSVVTEIAEQVHFLAINASIEASRAGEQGRGFSVVASEVKALADEAKKATDQVRRILAQIQGATSLTVSAAEEGTQGVRSAIDAVGNADTMIESLADMIGDAAQAAAQIAASAGQQASGISQINEAMKAVRQAATQTMSSTHQTERAAADLEQLGGRLETLLAGYGG